jgi:hypothetical protein
MANFAKTPVIPQQLIQLLLPLILTTQKPSVGNVAAGALKL